HGRFQGDGRPGDGEQRVEVGLRRLRPPEDRIDPLHAWWPIWRSSSASWARRCSSVGWVENSDEIEKPGAAAGVKKKALKGSAARRSRVGICPMAPVTLTSAEASVAGAPVMIAAPRSADSSR